MVTLLILLLLLPITYAAPASPPAATDATALFDFDTADEGAWEVVNDGVMGGRSRGYVEIESGVLRFSGTLVTRGGGFTSVRVGRRLDLEGFEGLELRVRGDGRTFEVEVSDGARSWGRSVSRRAALETREDWEWVRVPFDSLRPSIFGQPVRARPLDRSSVRSIGLYILDGIDGPFRLEVDTIRAYRAAAEAD